MEDCLKSKRKVYHLPRAIGEERVNDYNPLLLYLWKANMDLQYVGDASLALAHYVTAYITKAEKSHMQELWDDISEQETLYKKLWSFGVDHYVLESVVFMRLVTFCWEITCVKNQTQFSGLQLKSLKKEKSG